MAAGLTVVVLAPSAAPAWAENHHAGAARPLTDVEVGLPPFPVRWRMAKRFLGGASGGYVLRNASATDDWGEVVSDGGDITERSDAGWIVWGARRQSATERGAMLISRDGRIVRALGIIHFDCYGVWRSLPRGSPPHCTDIHKPLLTIFLRRTPDSSRFAKEISAWADRQEHHRVPYKITWVASIGR